MSILLSADRLALPCVCFDLAGPYCISAKANNLLEGLVFLALGIIPELRKVKSVFYHSLSVPF